MKKFTLFLFLLIFFSSAEAQKVYFVYLQSENQEQFYARLGEKIYNSTSSGYLILSKLVDSTYGLNIGVQESQIPEQFFSVTVSKKDKGYILKNLGEKGLGLFDLQSFAVVMPATKNSVNLVQTEKRDANAFTNLLAKATDDSTILEKPVFAKAEEKKTGAPVPTIQKNEEILKSVGDSALLKTTGINNADITAQKKEEIQKNINDSLIAKSTEKKTELPIQSNQKNEEVQKPAIDSASLKVAEIKNAEIPAEKRKEELVKDSLENLEKELKPVAETKTAGQTVTTTNPAPERKSSKNPFVDEFQKSIVVKRSESSTTEGFGITFLDVTGDGSIDTIRILIPNEKEKPVASEVKKEGLKFLDISSSDTTKMRVRDEQQEKVVLKNKKIGEAETGVKRSNICSQLATYEDFFKLRKNMADEISNDNMINEAKKMYRSKCFSTIQIKNLSALFLTDEGKYKFFDASYSHVSDIDNYISLLEELKEEYYINRFKAMLY